MQLEVNAQATGRDLIEMLRGETGTFYAEVNSQAFQVTATSSQSQQQQQSSQSQQSPITSLRPIGRRQDSSRSSSSTEWFIEKLSPLDISSVNELSNQEVQSLIQNVTEQQRRTQQQRYSSGS